LRGRHCARSDDETTVAGHPIRGLVIGIDRAVQMDAGGTVGKIKTVSEIVI
jgi:hypothetical protein